MVNSLFKFRAKDLEYFADGLFFEIGPFLDIGFAQGKDALRGVAADGLEAFDDPRIDLVAEVGEQHVFLIVVLILRQFAPDLDFAADEHTGELDVATALADTLLDLFGMHVNLDLVIRAVAHVDTGNLGRVEGALDQQLGVGRPLEHVDVLVAEHAHPERARPS